MKMKKLSLIALLTLVLSFTAFFAIGTLFVFAGSEINDSTSICLNLGSDMSVKAYADIDENATEVKAVFSWTGENGDYSDEVIGEKDESVTGRYLFVYKGLSAQHIEKTVSVEFFYNVGDEQKSFTRTFSIADYLSSLKEKSIITDNDEYNEYTLATLKTLANDILVYGKAAREYLGLTPSSLPDGVIGSDIYFDELSGVKTPVSGDGVASWKTGVRFDYNFRPLCCFTLKEATDEEVKVEILLDGEKVEEVTLYSADGRYIAVYADFGVFDYEKEYTFKVLVGGTEKGSLTYSLPALVLSKQSSTDAAAKLVNAVYSYSRSACEYASSRSFADFKVIEAEDGAKTGKGDLATGGVVAPYMSGGKFYRNFTAGSTLTYQFVSDDAYSSAEVYMIGSSGCVSEYDNGKPKSVKAMKANDLFSLSVNDTESPISDNAYFEGKSAESGDYSLFGNRTAVKLCKTQLKRGLNNLVFTFKDSPYKNSDNTSASANYDAILIVLNGKIDTSADLIELNEKIEFENLSFVHNTDAERAGDATLYPSYSSSGVSAYYSAKAFVKNIRKDGVLSLTFSVESDCVVNLVICGTSTSEKEAVDLSKVFALTLNGEPLTYSDSTLSKKPSDGWTPSETVAVKNLSLKAGVSYVLTFKSLTSGQDDSAFYDYIKFATVE